MQEVMFRFARLTVIYYPLWDRAVLINWLGESVSCTGDELQKALEMSQVRRKAAT